MDNNNNIMMEALMACASEEAEFKINEVDDVLVVDSIPEMEYAKNHEKRKRQRAGRRKKSIKRKQTKRKNEFINKLKREERIYGNNEGKAGEKFKLFRDRKSYSATVERLREYKETGEIIEKIA